MKEGTRTVGLESIRARALPRQRIQWVNSGKAPKQITQQAGPPSILTCTLKDIPTSEELSWGLTWTLAIDEH